MKPQTEFTNIMPVELLDKVSDLKEQGCRLVQICCSRHDDALELDYSFDRTYQLVDLKMSVTPADEIDSISAIFPPAFYTRTRLKPSSV